MFSPSYNYAWGCRCCSPDGGENGGGSNSNWNLHSVVGCGATPVPDACTSIEALELENFERCKLRLLLRKIKDTMRADCPHNKFVELEILTDNFGDRGAAEEEIVEICERGGKCLIEQAKGCGSQFRNLGTGYSTPEECADAAAENPGCGSAIMFSPTYNYAWGCRCCSPDGGENGGSYNTNWDLHSIRGCGATPVPDACTSIEALELDTFDKCKFRPLLQKIESTMSEDCPHNKNVELEILTDNFGDREAAKEAIVEICERGGKCLIEQARGCGSQFRNLGTGYSSPEECAVAASEDPGCGSAIMFSPTYNYSWGCRCCSPDGGETGGGYNTNWDLHSIRGCGSP